MHENTISTRGTAIFSALILTSLLAACGSGDDSGNSISDAAASVPPAAAASSNGNPVGTAPVATTPDVTAPVVSTPIVTTPAAPTISGSPASAIRVGSAYSFAPAAVDPNGDALSFSISGKPAWATFDIRSGKLSGTPGVNDQGSFSNITITVSDGLLSATLAPFGILVSPGTSGSASLSWSPPTSRTDGSSLDNLAGYRIYYGTSLDTMTNVIQITNPGLTSYTVGNLIAGTHYFAVSAYTTDGVEGDRSTVGSKTMM